MGFYIPSGSPGPVPNCPQFGILSNCVPITDGVNFAYLYLPVGLATMARHFLLQNIPGLLLGPNVGPLLNKIQIAQNGVRYVAISLDTSQQPLSAANAAISLFGLTTNLLPSQ